MCLLILDGNRTLALAECFALLDGNHPDGWFPEQRITAAEAVRAYTLDAAYANFSEERSGSIAPGKLADLVVLSRDILAEEERSRIAEARVTITVVAGRIVYQKEH